MSGNGGDEDVVADVAVAAAADGDVEIVSAAVPQACCSQRCLSNSWEWK